MRELALAKGWNRKLTPLAYEIIFAVRVNHSVSLMVGVDILQRRCRFYNPYCTCSREAINGCINLEHHIDSRRRLGKGALGLEGGSGCKALQTAARRVTRVQGRGRGH